MSIVIGSNIASLETQRQLAKVTADVGGVFERLSSGLRINHASDDAAGLSIASDLKATQRVFNQGVRNFNDGLALLNVADSAVEQLSSIVTRLKELSEQAANGTYGNAQRQALDREAQALSKEFTRIIKTTTYNGRQLLTSDFGQLRVQGSFGDTGGIQSSLGGSVGTGSLLASVSFFDGGTQDNSVALGDLNGDGKLDMVTSGYNGGSPAYIVARLGRGDGTFSFSGSYAAESFNSKDVTLGDMNGDGILDLISTGRDSNYDGRVTVRLGCGDGTFKAASSYIAHTDSVMNTLSIGDVNGDGNFDVISAGYFYTSAIHHAGFVTVALGRGDGTLTSAVSYTTENAGSYGYTEGLSLGDLNGDGILDIASTGYGGADGRVSVMLGNSDGSFRARLSFSSGEQNGSAVNLGDVNGDGNLDLIVAGQLAPSGAAAIHLGNGNGTFQRPSTYLMDPSAAHSIEAVDLNGDGALDLISAGEGISGEGMTTVRLGNGNGTFGAIVSYGGGGGSSLAIGDLNGDGVLDIATAGYLVAPTAAGGGGARLGAATNGVGALNTFSLATRTGALSALTQFDGVLTRLVSQRGTIGAFQSRIGTGVSTLQIGSENYATAASRITDADIAEESARLVRGNILQQAATAVLAQANVQPQIALLLVSGR